MCVGLPGERNRYGGTFWPLPDCQEEFVKSTYSGA